MDNYQTRTTHRLANKERQTVTQVYIYISNQILFSNFSSIVSVLQTSIFSYCVWFSYKTISQIQFQLLESIILCRIWEGQTEDVIRVNCCFVDYGLQNSYHRKQHLCNILTITQEEHQSHALLIETNFLLSTWLRYFSASIHLQH